MLDVLNIRRLSSSRRIVRLYYKQSYIPILAGLELNEIVHSMYVSFLSSMKLDEMKRSFHGTGNVNM